MLIAKLRRMTVAQADPNYVGSVAVDRTLQQARRLLPVERDGHVMASLMPWAEVRNVAAQRRLDLLGSRKLEVDLDFVA
jgi:hypothetical protein